jgi:hypothetical protein
LLPISAKQHSFNDRDLPVIQCHVGLSALELRSEQYGTIRAQSCVRGNVNPQISRLGNGPDQDPNPARRSLDLQRQSCPASCEGRRGNSKSAAVGARAGLPCSKPASFQFGLACATLPIGQRHGLGAEGSGLSKACRIEARSKRQRTNFRPRSIPGVLQTAQTGGAIQFNQGHSLTFPRTATLVEARAHRINLFQYSALRLIACRYLRPVRRFIRQLRILADARTADSEVNGCGRGDQNARRHLQGEGYVFDMP